MNQPPIEAMLKALVEGASEGVLAVDAEGTIRWANPRAGAIFAYGHGELTGRPVINLIPELLRARHWVHMAAYFHEPKSRPMGPGLELTGLRKDGSAFPVEASLSHLDLPDGELAVAFVTDITDRNRLQGERDRFFKLSPDLICILQRDGTFRQVNPAFNDQLGWTPEEVFGRPFSEFVHADDVTASQAAFQALLEGKRVQDFKVRCRCKDGSFRWLEWNAPQQSDPLIYAVARNVTEAQQAAEAEQRLTALVENIPDFVGLLAADETRHILYVNKAGREMLGLPPLADLRGMKGSDLLLVDPEVEAHMEAGLASHGRWNGETNLYHYRTREAIPVELSNFLVFFKGGSNVPIARAIVARDIRERKRTQERLHSLTGQLLSAQEEERRRIARDLHDDVTQKLAGMAIELGLLRRQTPPGPAAAKLFELQEQVAEVAEALRHLAHEIHPGVLEHVGLSSALEAYCIETSRQRGITIGYAARDVPEEIPREISLAVYRVAQEAIANAVKHSGAERVTVELLGMRGQEGDRLKLSVTDDGKGFLISDLGDGSGLGLLSVEERIHLVKGNFTIHSDPGAGTRLEVEIPLP